MAGNSLAVQWLRLHTSTSVSTGLIVGQETKTPYDPQYGQKKKGTNGKQAYEKMLNSICH